MGDDRLTARSTKNNMAYLVKVKPDEQVVESSYPNTLKCIMEGFNRLAEYEDLGTPSELAELVKAREEKQEGCEYCKQIITTVKMDFETDSILGENKWFSSTRRPNFCPMCGRKFRTEGDAL